MAATRTSESRDEVDAVVAAATAGDEAAFSEIVGRYQRELHVHCYRMLGSRDDADDELQETFLRAWRARGTYQGRSTFRAWLYRIATNTCLDAIERRGRRVPSAEATQSPVSEVLWLQPYPDRLLDEVASRGAEPEALMIDRETIELAFLVAIQHLGPRSRAILLLRDVLGWSANETAELLETSVATVTSALQRARATMRQHLPERRLEWSAGADPTEQERALLQRYIDASERGDAEALAATLNEDVRFSMPPDPYWSVGLDATVRGWVEGGFGSESWGTMRCVRTTANRQTAVAVYLKRPGDEEYRSLALDVLRFEDGLVKDVVTFPGDVFPAFDLPATLAER